LLGVWSFNFHFDQRYDLHNPASLAFLCGAGLDFVRHSTEGIFSSFFGLRLAASPLVRNRNISWVVFSGEYDFAYILKLYSGTFLPCDFASFEIAVDEMAPINFDLRQTLPQGSLSSLATMYGLWHRGVAHSGGSDALLTVELLFHALTWTERHSIIDKFACPEGPQQDSKKATKRPLNGSAPPFVFSAYAVDSYDSPQQDSKNSSPAVDEACVSKPLNKLAVPFVFSEECSQQGTEKSTSAEEKMLVSRPLDVSAPPFAFSPPSEERSQQDSKDTSVGQSEELQKAIEEAEEIACPKSDVDFTRQALQRLKDAEEQDRVVRQVNEALVKKDAYAAAELIAKAKRLPASKQGSSPDITIAEEQLNQLLNDMEVNKAREEALQKCQELATTAQNSDIDQLQNFIDQAKMFGASVSELEAAAAKLTALMSQRAKDMALQTLEAAVASGSIESAVAALEEAKVHVCDPSCVQDYEAKIKLLQAEAEKKKVVAEAQADLAAAHEARTKGKESEVITAIEKARAAGLDDAEIASAEALLVALREQKRKDEAKWHLREALALRNTDKIKAEIASMKAAGVEENELMAAEQELKEILEDIERQQKREAAAAKLRQLLPGAQVRDIEAVTEAISQAKAAEVEPELLLSADRALAALHRKAKQDGTIQEMHDALQSQDPKRVEDSILAAQNAERSPAVAKPFLSNPLDQSARPFVFNAPSPQRRPREHCEASNSSSNFSGDGHVQIEAHSDHSITCNQRDVDLRERSTSCGSRTSPSELESAILHIPFGNDRSQESRRPTNSSSNGVETSKAVDGEIAKTLPQWRRRMAIVAVVMASAVMLPVHFGLATQIQH